MSLLPDNSSVPSTIARAAVTPRRASLRTSPICGARAAILRRLSRAAKMPAQRITPERASEDAPSWDGVNLWPAAFRRSPIFLVLISCHFKNNFATLRTKRAAYASSADDPVERISAAVPSPQPAPNLAALQGRGHVPSRHKHLCAA